MVVYRIVVVWDKDAKVWSVDKSDIPGVSASCKTIEDLSSRLKVLVPEMIGLNNYLKGTNSKEKILLELLVKHSEKTEVFTCVY